MKLFKLLIAVILFFNYINAQDSVKISEYVRDFESHHLDSVVVHLKDRNFKDLYTTYSDKWGYYELKIPVSNLSLHVCNKRERLWSNPALILGMEYSGL